MIARQFGVVDSGTTLLQHWLIRGQYFVNRDDRAAIVLLGAGLLAGQLLHRALGLPEAQDLVAVRLEPAVVSGPSVFSQPLPVLKPARATHAPGPVSDLR